MAYETIRYTRAEGVATIALARPERMNALTAPMRRELLHALRDAAETARAVVLTGEGAAFCAGQDLGDAPTIGDLDLEGVLRDEYEPILRAIVDAPVPVVAAVNGAAAGAGCNLALCADIVIAARSARFIEAFARIGLIPDAGGTWLLPRMIGLPRAMGMCLLGEPISAERAAEWGLIWEVVEESELAARAEALARRLAEGPAVAHRLAKKALREGLAEGLDAQLDREARYQGEAGRSRDFAEGVAAFLEKRPPRFEGR